MNFLIFSVLWFPPILPAQFLTQKIPIFLHSSASLFFSSYGTLPSPTIYSHSRQQYFPFHRNQVGEENERWWWEAIRGRLPRPSVQSVMKISNPSSKTSNPSPSAAMSFTNSGQILSQPQQFSSRYYFSFSFLA